MRQRKHFVFRYYFHNRMLTDSLTFRADSRAEANQRLHEYFSVMQPTYYKQHPEKFTPKRVTQKPNTPQKEKKP